MALEQKLSVKMSHRLIMTPSLQQAIKLLQMSKLELVDEIQQELTENPVLDEVLDEAVAPDRPEIEPAPAVEAATPESGDAAEPSDEVANCLSRLQHAPVVRGTSREKLARPRFDPFRPPEGVVPAAPPPLAIMAWLNADSSPL